jgi:ATP-dependent protease Clp ATPase subunit
MSETNAQPPNKPRRVTRYGFCGKSSKENGPQIEGPNEVYICIPCVDLCADLIQRLRAAGKIPKKMPGESTVELEYDNS